ncbi:MAG: hypothetical protein ACK4FA_02670, partial [Candidatus Paceibacteria bacterium]
PEPEPVASTESEVLTIESNTEILNIQDDAIEIVENVLSDTTPIPEIEPETLDILEPIHLEASAAKASYTNEMLLLVFVLLSVVFIGIRLIKR